MKFFTKLFLICLLPAFLFGQANIFFSEYFEGNGGTNKALEIYNASDQIVNLDDYHLKSSANEATDWEFTDSFPAGATIAPGDVYVIIDDGWSIQALFDAADWVTSGFEAGFNGNDARGLFYNDGEVLLDMIGDPNNPGALNWDVAGVTDGTLNHTLVRKPSVLTGNSDWVSAAGTNAEDSEWIVLDENIADNLGFHVFEGGSLDLPPTISNLTASTKVPAVGEQIDVSATVTDDSSLVKVELFYSVNEGDETAVAMSTTATDVYSGTIPSTAYGNGDRVVYYILAEDGKAQQRIGGETKLYVGEPAIVDVKQLDENGALVFDGYYAKLTGVLTAGSETFSTTDLQVYLQDGSAAINLYLAGAGDQVMTKGNSYTAVGKIIQFSGLTEIEPDDANTDIVDNGPAELPEPITLTIAQLLSNPEAFESFLITIASVDSLPGGDAWPAADNNANINITDDGGTSQIVMRLDRDTDIDGTAAPLFPINVTGIFNQFDNSSPFDAGYQILPRSLEDIDVAVGIENDKPGVTPLVFKLYDAFPNPFNPKTTLKFDLPLSQSKNTIELSIFNVLGQKVSVLTKGKLNPGQHTFVWNAIAQPSGIYFAVLNTGTAQQISRLLLIK